MKLDKLKAFPYPVLREGSDDYTDGVFQVPVLPEIEGEGGGLILRIKGNFQISVDEIKDLVDKGLAKYSITVDCRDTFTREFFEYSDSTFEIEFKPGALDGEFVISPCIVATEDISGFQCQYINEEFGPGPFNFAAGNILAQAEDQTHFITREFFKPITSIFVFEVNQKITENTFKVELDGEKIAIQVNQKMKDQISLANSQKKYHPVVFNALYLPCLVRVLATMDGGDNEQMYEGKTWFEVVKSQLTEKGFQSPIKDPLEVAQIMLRQPMQHLINEFKKMTEGEQ